MHGWVQCWDAFNEIVSYGDPDGYIWCICNQVLATCLSPVALFGHVYLNYMVVYSKYMYAWYILLAMALGSSICGVSLRPTWVGFRGF